ncbi:MAG: hypothetical protein LUE99_12760 [Bacteroides sp.]|nr:hypothetical protein [Bacteroides sp.]
MGKKISAKSLHNGGGELINLDQYPKAKKYLETHRERLSKRYIASKTPDRWYRTIDRIVPSLQSQPKVLLPDMSGNTFVFVDDGRYYPLHNIYYITGHSAVELHILTALLMSDFVREQLASVTNKMNGGFSRWQSQHLRKLRLPDIMSIPADDIRTLLASYNDKNVASINALIPKLLATSPKRTSHREYMQKGATLQFVY